LIVRYLGPDGALARTGQVGTMTLWVVIVLCVYLVVYLL
jgi:hypothetical protein